MELVLFLWDYIYIYLIQNETTIILERLKLGITIWQAD